jgi:hypothetical protein
MSKTKEIRVQIATNDLQALKQSGYNLCFAKKVNNSFNVVWKSSSNYLAVNLFSWTAQYELFGSNTFQNGVVVRSVTNTQTCGLGESCTLTQNGILEPAVTDGPATSLTFKNEYGQIHTGVNQQCTGIEGKISMNTIYVSEYPIVQGFEQLTPKDEVIVWFQQDAETGTMNSQIVSEEAVSNSIQLNLTQTDEVSCLYENGQWKIV